MALELTSKSFRDGEVISKEHTADGKTYGRSQAGRRVM
jgi:hypothetical protein